MKKRWTLVPRLALTLGLTALLLGALVLGLSEPLRVYAQPPEIFSEDFTGFTGSGFAPSPATGQLDSNLWRMIGLSDGDGSFGGTYTTGDFARGSSMGGVSSGGIYAFDVGGGNTVLGAQPAGSDFTPGSFDLRLQNDTGAEIDRLVISYTIWTYNDAERANSLNFAYSLDDSTYTAVPALDYVTPETADASPAWERVSRETILTDLALAPSDYLYLRWSSDDVSGGGSRDELGIGNVVVSVYEELSATKTVTPSKVTANDTVTYTIVVDNDTSSDEVGALFTDTLPSEVTFGTWIEKPAGASVTADEITWSGNLSASMALTFTFTANHVGSEGDVVVNTATYSGSQIITATATFTVAAPSDITFVYHDLEDVVKTGESVYLAGSFNSWDDSALMMNADAAYETFSVTLLGLDAGTINYKYIVYTDTVATSPPQWEWLNTSNRSYTVSGDATVDDYRDVNISWANLQWPFTLEADAFQPTDPVYGQVYIPNITDLPGQGRGILAQVGYGDMIVALPSWDWFPMDYNVDASSNDEYMGVLTPTMGGVFSYTTRFNANWGTGNPNSSWYYPTETGVLTVTLYDAAVTKTALTTDVFVSGDANALANFLIEIDNLSNITATDSLTLTDILPAGFAYVSDDSGLTPTEDSGTLTWAFTDPLAAGGTLSFTLTLSATGAITESGPYTNTVNIETVPTDWDTVNNTDQATVMVYAPMTIAEVRAQFAAGTLQSGDLVLVEGIATAPTGIYYAGGGYRKTYIQDATAGVQVRGAESVLPVVTLGDTLRVVAEVSEYFGELQLQPQEADLVWLTDGQPTDVPAPAVVGVDEIDEPYEGELIQTEGQIIEIRDAGFGDTFLTLWNNGESVTVMVTDEAISDMSAVGVGDWYRVTGVVAYEYGEYRVKPRIPDDLTPYYPTELLITKVGPAKVLAGDVFSYTLTAYNATTETLQNVTITDTLPLAYAELAAIGGSGTLVGDTIGWTTPTLGMGDVWQVSFAVTATGSAGDVITNAYYGVDADNWYPVVGLPVETEITAGCPTSYTPIYEIQGSGAASPITDTYVTSCGVVVGLAPGLKGFFIQDPSGDTDPNTSDGIFVYRQNESFAMLELGDLVSVEGWVDEYYGSTQISAKTTGDTVTILANSRPLPAPVSLDPPADEAASDAYLEDFEGMLVEVPVDVNVVGPTNAYGEYYFVRSDMGITRLVLQTNPLLGYKLGVDDGIVPSDDYVVGDVLNGIYGPLHFTFDNWKVEQLTQPRVVSNTVVPAFPEGEPATAPQFSIGSLNTLNFDGEALAGNPDKLDKLVAAIEAMGAPAFLSLQEITVIDSYNYYDTYTVTGVITPFLDALTTAGYNYDYLFAHPDGGGHGVAVLYDTDRVTLDSWSTPIQGCSPYGSSGTAAAGYDPISCPSGEYPTFSRRPVVITGTVEMNGEPTQVTVIGLHLKSGFDEDDILRRQAQAELVADYVDILTTGGQTYVALAGDMNDFVDSNVLNTLEATGTLTNTFYTLPPEERYSYVYNGVSQVLDHILISMPLYDEMVDFYPLHINADYPAGWEYDEWTFYRSSDHDPVVAIFGNYAIYLPAIFRNYP